MNMPPWWVNWSGAFFIVGTVAFLAIVAMLVKLWLVLNELKPKVDSLAKKVDSIAEKLDSAATSAKSTVETVGSGTRQMVGSLQGVVTGSAQQLGKLSTYFVAAMTIIRLYKELSSLRASAKVDRSASEEA